MTQSVVTVRLNGTPYQIGCGAGEEAHVAALGTEVETILQELIGAVGQIGEARLLAMVTLILADKLGEAAAGNTAAVASTGTGSDTGSDTSADDSAAAALESAAEKIANLASALATRAAKD